MNQSTPASGYAVAGISGLALILIMLLFAWFATPFNGWDAFKAFHDWVLFFLIFTAFAGMALGGWCLPRLRLPLENPTEATTELVRKAMLRYRGGKIRQAQRADHLQLIVKHFE